MITATYTEIYNHMLDMITLWETNKDDELLREAIDKSINILNNCK